MHLSTNILAGMQGEVHKFSEDQPWNNYANLSGWKFLKHAKTNNDYHTWQDEKSPTHLCVNLHVGMQEEIYLFVYLGSFDQLILIF